MPVLGKVISVCGPDKDQTGGGSSVRVTDKCVQYTVGAVQTCSGVRDGGTHLDTTDFAPDTTKIQTTDQRGIATK